jgi:hypothetical protein
VDAVTFLHFLLLEYPHVELWTKPKQIHLYKICMIGSKQSTSVGSSSDDLSGFALTASNTSILQPHSQPY